MIFHLNGQVTEREEDFIVVDVNGVGYQVYVPNGVIEACELQSPIKLYTYHHIREDAVLLFGFTQLTDRHWFVMLTSVSGLGPKGAIKVLSSISTEQLTHALMGEDLITLTRIPGVGKKLAERMIMELKDKLAKMPLGLTISATASGRSPAIAGLMQELTLALRSLGYTAEEVRNALARSPELSPEMTVETAIKTVLKHLL